MRTSLDEGDPEERCGIRSQSARSLMESGEEARDPHGTVVSLRSVLEAVDEDSEASGFPNDPRVLDDQMQLMLRRSGLSEGPCNQK